MKNCSDMLTWKEWLAKFGKEPCDGCQYFIMARAKCTYKRGNCVRYDRYRVENSKKK